MKSFRRIRSVCYELLLLLLLLPLEVNSGESEYLCGTTQVVETSATRNSFYVRIIHSFRFSLSPVLFATIIALSNDMPLRLVNYIFVLADRRPVLPIRFVILCLWSSGNSVRSSSRFLFLLRTCILNFDFPRNAGKTGSKITAHAFRFSLSHYYDIKFSSYIFFAPFFTNRYSDIRNKNNIFKVCRSFLRLYMFTYNRQR